MNIKQALSALDHRVDGHWTSDGLPRMDVLQSMTGDASLTRKHVTDSDPSLTREHAKSRSEDRAASDALVEAEIAEQLPSDGESVLSMPIQKVLSSHELTALAVEEIDEKMKEALRAKGQIELALQQLNAKNELLKRALVAHERRIPSNQRKNAVQEYLAAQNRARAARAERALAFIAAGTTARDVADALRPSSKLDDAMNRRKAPLGAARPAVRPLA